MSAVAYFLSNAASDLTNPSAVANNAISTAPTSGTLNVTVTAGATVTASFFTPSGSPGASGTSTGVFYFALFYSGGNGSLQVNVVLNRVNSSGAVQASVAGTEQTSPGASAPIFYKFSNPALGTWNLGDRLRVDLTFRNSGGTTLTNAGGVALGDLSKSWVSLPWNPNIIAQPEDLTTTSGYWSTFQSSITANATTAPDGNVAAEQLGEAGGTGTHIVYETNGIWLPADAFVASMFGKAGPSGRTQAKIILDGAGGDKGAIANLSTSAIAATDVGYTSGASSQPNGFTRFYTAITLGAAGNYFAFPSTAASGSDSTDGTSTGGIYAWGVVLEPGTTPSAYPGVGGGPVSGSMAATESPDTASITGAVAISGSMAATEAKDAASIAGTIGGVVSGSLAATEAPDTASISGTVSLGTISGSLTATEAPDSFSAVAPLPTPATTGELMPPGSLAEKARTRLNGILAAIPTTLTDVAVSYDPPSLASGAVATIQTATLTGASLGDYVAASFSLDLQGLRINAWVSAADTVKFQFANPTAGTLDLAAGTVRLRVAKH